MAESAPGVVDEAETQDACADALDDVAVGGGDEFVVGLRVGLGQSEGEFTTTEAEVGVVAEGAEGFGGAAEE